MTRLSAQQVVAGVRDLPTLPAVVVELIRSLGKNDISAGELAIKISHDQALAAKTLRLANSSFYGMSRQVTSLADATAILGLRTVRCVATAAGLAGVMSMGSCKGFDFKAFWRHSVATALCTRDLARARKMDEETAFVVGLLHDIGRLALASCFPSAYADVIAYQAEHDCLPLDAERLVLGTDHVVAGVLITEHWRFTPAIVEAIGAHHDPAGAGGVASLGDLVHIADNIAHGLDLSGTPDDIVPPLSMDAWLRLALAESECRAIFHGTESQYESVCQALLA